jgi:hypothetical protein
LKIALHSGQQQIHRVNRQFKTVVSGRRFGKSRYQITNLILRALSFEGEVDPQSPETVVGALPSRVQAKPILWRPLVDLFEKTELKNICKNINRSELIIELHGKPNIQITGAGEGLRGKRIYHFAGDEVQDFPKQVFDEVIVPAMADTRGSTALLTGTPKGRNNILFTLFERAREFPDEYASFNMPTHANPLIPRSFLDKQKLILPPRIYEQEFQASFVSFPGQVFTELDANNKAPDIPRSYSMVILGVDFGDVHPAIVAVGLSRGTWYLLEAFAPTDGAVVPQPHFDDRLISMATKYNASACYCDPSRPSSILSIRQLGIVHRLPGLEGAIAGYNRIPEGLGQLISLIYQNRLKIATADTKPLYSGHRIGSDLYQDMQDYHYARNSDGDVIQDKIEDGQIDHAIDALRYALALPGGLPSDIRS